MPIINERVFGFKKGNNDKSCVSEGGNTIEGENMKKSVLCME